MSDHTTVAQFVREVLGCQCPEAVLNTLEILEPDKHLPVSGSVRTIVVGQRLLIYLWRPERMMNLECELSSLIIAGRQERDRRKLNRFRAVIATDQVASTRVLAERSFGQIGGLDDKVHLHVVDEQDARGL
jgi:hypothetical protein